MAQYDGSLKFDTSIDGAGFNAGIKNLTSDFQKVGKNVTNLTNRFNMLNNYGRSTAKVFLLLRNLLNLILLMD